jgi:hypothetical protein
MFSVGTVQLCHRLALPFWGQVFSPQDSTLSSTRHFGAVFSVTTVHFQSPQFNFVIDSRCLFGAMFSVGTVQLYRRIALPFWGQVRSRHGSTLSSNRHFGARFSVSTVQLCHRIAILGPCEKSPRFNFVVESPFWSQVFSQHSSTLSSNRHFGAV